MNIRRYSRIKLRSVLAYTFIGDDKMDIFCKMNEGEIPCKKIYEDEEVFVILDINPISNGHCLVIPKVHYKDLYDIDKKVLSHIIDVGIKMGDILKDKLHCEGVTFEQNNGIAQEVKHFHLHVIPRYKYDDIIDVDEVYNIITSTN